MAAPAGLFLLLFFLAPLAYVLALALSPGDDRSVMDTIRELATTRYYRSRILFTFEQAAWTTVLTLAAGLPLAYLFAQRRFAAKGILRALLTVPFVLPPLVVAIALQSAFGRNGFVDDATGLDVLAAIGPYGSILVAHVLYNIGLVVRLVGNYWARIPPELLEAARTLGAGRVATLARVLVPVGLPAIAATAALVFLFATTSFGIILLLGGPGRGTLETLIYAETGTFRPDYPAAALLGAFQIAATALALVAYLALERRGRTRFSPRTVEPTKPLGWPGRLVLLGGLAFVLVPMLTLLRSAFFPSGRLAFDGLRLLVSNERPLGSYEPVDAVLNSLQFAALAVILSVPLALAAAYALRGLRRGRNAAETVLLTPLGTSSVLVGLGFLLLFDGDPLWDLRAHPLRIVVAHTLIAFPFVARILVPSLEALEPRLMEAARTLGANGRQVLRRVELPLLVPALVAGAVFAFATSLGEFGATLVLRRPEYTTIPLAIFDAYGRPGAAYRAQAETLAALLAIVAALGFWLLERVRSPLGGDFR